MSLNKQANKLGRKKSFSFYFVASEREGEEIILFTPVLQDGRSIKGPRGAPSKKKVEKV